MDLIRNKYYIIRTGDFATNANKKLIYILLSLLLCLHDGIENKNIEYLAIMAYSSIIWSIVEFVLNVQRVRIIKPMKIYWNNSSLVVDKYMGICLQGAQEGGAVTIIGLYFGDRMYSLFYNLIYHVLIGYMVWNMAGKETNNKVLSKRQINTPGSLALMSGATIFNTWILINYPQHFYREMGMFLSMVYISGIWTVVSYYKDFRRVEVQLYQHRCNLGREYVRKLDTFLDAFFILGYDVVFEIGMAYITFYNIVLMLHSQVMTRIQNIPIYK